MAVLKIVPKLYQEKISEKLKEEISLVTNGEAKYYNRLYKFFQYTDIQCTADINYETRKMYMDSLEKEDISEKYKAELLSLFDRLKIENMPDVYSQGKPFSVEQEFFKQDKLFLLYHVNIMIYENDIRDDNGNYFEFRTHRFRHTFGVKLTEMKLDDDSIARLLGHKDTRTIPHYRRLRNEALAEDTKAVRDEMNELLAQYRREKENAETR